MPITTRSVLPLLGAFYYSSGRPRVATAPRLGARTFYLKFRNGYATGIVSTAKLDRFLSYGVNLDRFAQGRWYRLPIGLAAELRRLSKQLRPMRLDSGLLSRSA